MSNLNKIVRVGRVNVGHKVPVDLFCRIEITAGRLCITGVEGPRSDNDCWGASGQLDMHPWDLVGYAPGWSAELVAKFREVWKRWHLNDMRAGSPAQEQWLLANPVTWVYPESHYTRALAGLQAAGLNPDPNYLHNGKPYAYGSTWVREKLPAEVVEFLTGLPDADKQPAWV